ncbi:MAG: energy transducer TonB [Acidobacteriota bacterium]|nr:energy transducer TonB [Acidobacteriota bacterium]
MKLGPIPFPPGYQPYTPPERRRRKRRREREGQGVGVSNGSKRVLSATGRTGVTEGWVSIDPDGGTDYVPFLGVQPKRIRGALGASLASHVLAFAVILLVIRATPVSEEIFVGDRTNYGIVWIPQVGLGGGGGGGGNESLEMPRQVEVAGEDDLNVPVDVPEEPVEVEAPLEPDPPPLESQNMQLSALAMAAAPQARTGVLEGLMARAESVGSGTDGGAGAGDGGGIGAGQADGLGPGQGGGAGGGVYRPGNGVETPRLLREVTPKYTAEAMRAKVQGIVLVEAVVLPDGSVGDVTIIRSLDRNFGLDDEAIKAARQWRFQPGMRFGEPVAVLVTIELSFTLR